MLHSIYTMTTKHNIISVRSHLVVGSEQLCLSYLSRPHCLVYLAIFPHLYLDQTAAAAQV